MGFLKKGIEFKYSNDESHTVPYEWAKQQIVSTIMTPPCHAFLIMRTKDAGTAKPSFVYDILSDSENKYSDQIIVNVLGDMFTAGSDTVRTISDATP